MCVVCCAGKAGVSFTGDIAVGYRANLWLRSAIRVLLLLGVHLGGADLGRRALQTKPRMRSALCMTKSEKRYVCVYTRRCAGVTCRAYR